MVPFEVRTDGQTAVTDITAQVADALPDDADGTATVFVRHTTAAVTVNEGERRLLSDLGNALVDLVPNTGYAHDEIDGNADSHVRATLIGPDVTIPVSDGEPDMGTWQSVLLVECDGPRTRTVDVRV
jgi:secondary thiamine-phosphate synthase enzyme